MSVGVQASPSSGRYVWHRVIQMCRVDAISFTLFATPGWRNCAFDARTNDAWDSTIASGKCTRLPSTENLAHTPHFHVHKTESCPVKMQKIHVPDFRSSKKTLHCRVRLEQSALELSRCRASAAASTGGGIQRCDNNIVVRKRAARWAKSDELQHNTCIESSVSTCTCSQHASFG